MHQDKLERMTAHVIQPEMLDSLKAEVAGDIRSFVANILAEDGSVYRMLGDAGLRFEVIDTLTTRAHGNFYFASVSLQQIKDQINISGIRETLRRTSEDIDHEIVHNVLHTINQQCEPRAKLAQRILALLTAAKEPMTAEALCDALGMSYVLESQPHPRELEKDLIPDVDILVKCCKGLIAIHPATRLVNLAQDDIAECLRRHRSAHLSRKISGTCAKTDHFSAQETRMLAFVSLAYLSMSILAEGPCHQLAALRKRLHEYPFLGYAARQWGHHFRELYDDPFSYRDLNYAALELLEKAKSLESIVQICDLDADLVCRLEAPQNGRGHDEALDATRIRSGISALQVLSGFGITRMVIDIALPRRIRSFEPDSFGTSAIHEAAQAGWGDIVSILMEAGADPSCVDRNGKSPLYYAARSGCDKAISVLGGGDQTQDNYYELVLAFREAVEVGEAHVVVRLLEFIGRDTTRDRSTILLSIRAGHLNILEILLAHGADLSCPVLSPSDRIPLHQAIKLGRTDMAKLLLDRGADLQTLDDKKRSAVFETLKASNTDGLCLLLDREILTDCPDSEGNTVLHQAAADGSVAHARLLIDQTMISKTAFNNEGLTPLHLAARAQQFEIADMLLKCEDVDVNVKAIGGAAGRTPLTYAVVAGSLRLCDLLVQKGAFIKAREYTHLLEVSELAKEGDSSEIESLLITMWNRRKRG